jgi:hypothetical protein
MISLPLSFKMKYLSKLVLLILAAWTQSGLVSCAETTPSAKIPYQAMPLSLTDNPASEMAGAAVIRSIQNEGDSGLAEPGTVIHVSYDQAALYVVADMQEQDNGYPHAETRSPTGDLSQDDAFQVVLGLADPAPSTRR